MARERKVKESENRIPIDQYSSTSIVHLKEKKLEQELKKLGMSFRKLKSYSRINNWSAYTQGQSAGDKVNLSRPINNANGNSVRMLT